MHRKTTDPFDIALTAEWLGKAPASEQLFFAAAPVAHIVAYEDHRRESRLARLMSSRPMRAAGHGRETMILAVGGSHR
jgi:hypothetical protein